MPKIKVIEETLRDGCHGLATPPTLEQVAEIGRRLDEVGVYAIDVGLGLGLCKDTKTTDMIRAAKAAVKKAKICTLIVPGCGTEEDLEAGAAAGLDMVRIGVVCTRPDLAVPFIKKAKELRLETGVFFMVSHMLSANELKENGRIVAEAGADFIVLGDSIGAMISEDIQAKTIALRDCGVPIGIHTHNSLGVGVATTVEGLKEGCTYVDGSMEGLGAGSGNANLQAVVAVAAKSGFDLGLDIDALNQIAKACIRPLMDKPQEIQADEIVSSYREVFPEVLNRFR